MGSNITTAILEFFSNGKLLKSVNHTWITLLPKVKQVESMKQIRPIGLCSVLYKIISKILTDRLSKILPKIISPTQNGFINGRSITDNILISHEIMHFLSESHNSTTPYMALKLDMEKAYDRVEWSFLFGLSRLLGFREKWLEWIFTCLSTTSFSVILNGTPFRLFYPNSRFATRRSLIPDIIRYLLGGTFNSSPVHTRQW